MSTDYVSETIKVKPITWWCKNRVRQHGDTFIVIRRVSDFRVLVESVGYTYRGEKWKAWFDLGVDCEEIAV